MAEHPPLLIYGNGAMARVAYSFARRVRPIVGFTVDDAVIGNAREFCALPIHAFSNVEHIVKAEACEILIAVGYRDMNDLRLRKAEEARAKGYRLGSYVDRATILHDDVTIGENSIVLDHVSVHPGARIGDSVFISSNANLGHDCVIGDGAWINGGVSMAGGCAIGKGAFFGVNACAAQGVSIGDHAYIGANTLVNRDIGAGEVLLSPAGERFRLASHDFLKFARAA